MSLRRLDPLAQSFFVQSPVFVTKVDLFFAEKDDALPVFMQIRKNKEGKPSPDIVNFSQTFIPAANVVTSSNANVATTVSFEHPVFLDIGEYSLTLGSDSKDYFVYVSQLDGVDVTTSQRITDQPLIGSLFKSQNASEWTSTQVQDLKFRMYKAVFDTNVTATVNLQPVQSINFIENLNQDALEVYPNSTVLKVYHFNHAMVNNSYIKFFNLANANVSGNVGQIYGIDGNLIQGPYFQISNVKFDSYTITLPQAVTGVTEPTRFGGDGILLESRDAAYASITPQIPTFKPSNTNITHKVITTTPSTGASYTVDSTFTQINNSIENKLPTTRVFVGRTNKINKTANAESFQYRIELSTDNPDVSPIIDIKQLGVNLKRNLVNNPSYESDVYAHETVVITGTGQSNVYPISSTVGLIALNNTADQNNAKAIINGTLLNITANINDGQYRVVDVLDNGANIKVAKLSGTILPELRANTALANTYVITNSSAFIAEEAAEGGSVYSKYITRQVDLVNPSTSIKFFLDVAKPINANLKFYYKAKLASDSTNLRDVEYTEITNVTIPNSLGGEFYEVSKQLDNIPAFNSLVFKVVFLSSDESQVPRIKNLRIIALE
jgi:hypothetical protein